MASQDLAAPALRRADLDSRGRHVSWLGITLASLVVPLYVAYGVHAWVTRFSWKRRVQSVIVSTVAITLVAGASASLTNDTADSHDNQTATRQYSPSGVVSGSGEAAPGPTTVEDPGQALARQALAVYRGNSALAWQALHPAQQVQVPEDWFAKCASNAGRGAPVTSITPVGEASPAPITVDGATYQTIAVTLRYAYYNGEQREFVRHAVFVDGTWRWLMIGTALRESRKGICGVYFGEMA